jgi:hypothetical protein
MFGKKKPSLAPYALQVLTTEYFIQGTVDGDARLYLYGPEMLGRGPIKLANVKIQPTWREGIKARTCDQFEVWGDSAVALIPHVDFTQLVQYEVWKIPAKPLQGIFYFGPYLVQGTLMRLRDDSFEKEGPMFDVYITNQASGTKWGELRAPFALINMHWLHGFEPR